jgi:[NiFe] hydrogenase diaphorase moiety large subunit
VVRRHRHQTVGRHQDPVGVRRCARPGIYEYPFGVSIRQVLEDCGATDTQAVQVSGPSGICVAENEFDRIIGFEDIPTAGAFTIFNKSRDMFQVARNYVHFFQHESCGFCTPCRVGTSLLKNLMDKLHNGARFTLRLRRNRETEPVAAIDEPLRPRPYRLQSGARHHRQVPAGYYDKRMEQQDFTPAFDLDRALAAARQMTGRDDPGAHIITEHGGKA